MADNSIDPAKLREEINAENDRQREAPMNGVYAGPDAMSMMMVYAGPMQMQMRDRQDDPKKRDGFAFFMSAYAGPQPDGPMPGGMAEMIRQGGVRPQPREGTYCFCPECGRECSMNFCPECGTPLKDQPRYRDCQGCGTRLGDNARFCHECGKPVKSDETMKA